MLDLLNVLCDTFGDDTPGIVGGLLLGFGFSLLLSLPVELQK